MIVDLGGGRGWLEDGPAKSIAKIDKRLGHRLQITEAGRSRAQADANYAAYLRYLNGGPWAPIALPGDQSIHCIGGAIDTNEGQNWVWLLNEYGWFHTVYRNGRLVEAWHFEYFAHRDQHRDEVIQLVNDNGTWRFASDMPPIPAPKEIDDMVPFFDNGRRVLWPNGYFDVYDQSVYNALKYYFVDQPGNEQPGTAGTVAREVWHANNFMASREAEVTARATVAALQAAGIEADVSDGDIKAIAAGVVNALPTSSSREGIVAVSSPVRE